MGDMADLIADSGWDNEWYDEEPKRPTCKHCGTKNLVWRRTFKRWTLWENNGLKMHLCPIPRKMKENSMSKFETFWILWQPGSSLPPTRRFSTRKEAKEVAEYMTKKHNREFYVMKSDGLCELAAPPVKWSDARAN